MEFNICKAGEVFSRLLMIMQYVFKIQSQVVLQTRTFNWVLTNELILCSFYLFLGACTVLLLFRVPQNVPVFLCSIKCSMVFLLLLRTSFLACDDVSARLPGTGSLESVKNLGLIIFILDSCRSMTPTWSSMMEEILFLLFIMMLLTFGMFDSLILIIKNLYI